jgi:hypothetical protein
MPDTERPLPLPPQSKAVSKRHTRLSLVWVIPIVAAIAGAWVAVVRILGEGPSITLQFNSAEGLEAGKTKIEHNGVVVGTIMTIRLADDHEHVIATAQMAPKTQSFLVEDTRFWVVRPRISGSKVSGLGTLISGAYVAIDIGKATQSKREFTALEAPPIVAGDVAGRFFTLKTPDLGSLDTGTPLYFRRVQVGQVASFALDPDGHALTIKVFVRAPYDQYVTSDTRFWHASGVDVSLSADGLRVQTQSALSVLIGGIAFETPASGPVLPAAEADTAFTLFADRADAFKPAARDPQTYVLVFKQSLRGLVPGAPVEFRGIPIGEVVAVLVRGEKARGLDESLAIEFSGWLRVGIHQGTQALSELSQKHPVIGPGPRAANQLIPEIDRRSDGSAAGQAEEAAHRDRLDRPPDTRAALGGRDAEQPLQQWLFVANIHQGVGYQLIEDRPETHFDVPAIDLDQDRPPVRRVHTRPLRRVTEFRRILALAERAERGGKTPLQPGRLIRAAIERSGLRGDLQGGPAAVDSGRDLAGPGSDPVLAGVRAVRAEAIERVTEVDQAPGSAERLMLSLPQRRAQGNLGGDQLGDQLWTSEGMEVGLVHRSVIDVRAVFQPAARERRGVDRVGGREAVDDGHGRGSAPRQVGGDAASSGDRELAGRS